MEDDDFKMTSPPTTDDCEECDKVVGLEKVLGITGLVAGLLIVAFAADLLLGGRLADRLDRLAPGGGTDE
jgi:hypothetical protein